MNSFFNHKEVHKFEDEFGWENVLNSNVIICKTLGFEPEIEWVVGNQNSSCYHPKHCGFDHVLSQKNEAEKWVENNAKYCNTNGYSAIKNENYLLLHNDWNNLIEAIKRFNDKFEQKITPDVNRITKL